MDSLKSDNMRRSGGDEGREVSRSRSRSRSASSASVARSKSCGRKKKGRTVGYRRKLTKCGVKGRARKRRAYVALRGGKYKCLTKNKNYVRVK